MHELSVGIAPVGRSMERGHGRGKRERRRADRDGKDEAGRARGLRREGQRAGNKLWARGVWHTCYACPGYAPASGCERNAVLKFCLNARQAFTSSRAISPEIARGNSATKCVARSTNRYAAIAS